jgi:hypothetical protein
VHPKTPYALRRAAVVLALAGTGLLVWSLPPPAAAAPLSTRLPPPSTTVFECTVNGRPEFTDQPCTAADVVEAVKVVHAEIENEQAVTPRAADVQGEDSASYNFALLLASFACMAYLLRGRHASK